MKEIGRVGEGKRGKGNRRRSEATSTACEAAAGEDEIKKKKTKWGFPIVKDIGELGNGD